MGPAPDRFMRSWMAVAPPDSAARAARTGSRPRSAPGSRMASRRTSTLMRNGDADPGNTRRHYGDPRLARGDPGGHARTAHHAGRRQRPRPGRRGQRGLHHHARPHRGVSGASGPRAGLARRASAGCHGDGCAARAAALHPGPGPRQHRHLALTDQTYLPARRAPPAPGPVTHGVVVVSAKGAARWRQGHPWIYRSDVVTAERLPAGLVRVTDRAKRFLGQALFSPASEIRLRLLTREEGPVDRDWWRQRLAEALARRAGLASDTSAYRVVHAEGDGLPSLMVDRYGDAVVAQILSAGLEVLRPQILEAVQDVLHPRGVLLRNDASVRRHEGLPLEIVDAAGVVPETVEVRECGIRYLVSPREGQKTGAFLDQRENRLLVAGLAQGDALDVFTYQGLFALHMARRCAGVLAVDSSPAALAQARRNAELNGRGNVEWREANAFDLLRALEREGRRFDAIVLDPPAFAKQKSALRRALAGYKEINLRALRLLQPSGLLYTASCSFHVDRAAFLDMLADAAADSGRRVALEQATGQSSDHPELLTVPETGYLKGAVVRALD